MRSNRFFARLLSLPCRPAQLSAHQATVAPSHPASVGVASDRLDRLHKGDAGLRRSQGSLRHRHAGRARRARSSTCTPSASPDVEKNVADEDRYDLPHRLDDQADHQRRDHDAVRGREAVPHRSGLEVHPGVQELDGDGRRRRRSEARAGAARDHDSRSALASIGDHLRIPEWRRGRRRLSQERRHRRLDVDDDDARGGHQQARGRAAREPAGRGVQLQPLHRRARPRRRSRVGPAVRRVPARAHLQAAEDGRYRFRRAGREVVAIRDRVFAGRQGRHPPDERSRDVRQHQHVAVGVLQGRQDLFLRRRRPGLDGERLRALRATCC